MLELRLITPALPTDDSLLTSEFFVELESSNIRFELDELLTLQEEIESRLQLCPVNTDDLRRDGARGGEGHESDLTWTTRFLEHDSRRDEQHSSSRIKEPKEAKTMCSCNPVLLLTCAAATLCSCVTGAAETLEQL